MAHRNLGAQGATEYLILLAVVLIVALVSISLLGFYPGTAGDSQFEQNRLYWLTASPIAVVEAPGAYTDIDYTPRRFGAYIRFRNNANYPITITGIFTNTSQIDKYLDVSQGLTINMSINLQPGEESCVGVHETQATKKLCTERAIEFTQQGSASNFTFGSLSQVCDDNGHGMMVVPGFGFEYIEDVGGQKITKRFRGAEPLMIKCIGICTGATAGWNCRAT